MTSLVKNPRHFIQIKTEDSNVINVNVVYRKLVRFKSKKRLDRNLYFNRVALSVFVQGKNSELSIEALGHLLKSSLCLLRLIYST